MRNRLLNSLVSSTDAAVAPIVAISLFGLIAVGGIAFDYARMATLDTELQAAADQAALAAATQLDGKPDAITRATTAAQNLIKNTTLFANDQSSDGSNVTIPDITFYSAFLDDGDDTNDTETDVDEDAHYVKVVTGPRDARFALTPVVGVLPATDLKGTAVAALGSAICNVPPIMMCNPKEGTDPDFTVSDYARKGLLLVAKANQADPWGPGNFGFLDTGYDESGNGNKVLRKALGQEHLVANCAPGGTVTTQPGAGGPALDALNTRFDILSANISQNDVCGSGQCPASTNVRKDLVRQGTGNGSCDFANGGSKGWKEPNSGKYLPTSATADLGAAVPLSPMGHPRDKCHAYNPDTGCPLSGTTHRIGTGDWDRAAYFRSNFGSSFNWQSAMTAEYGRTDVSRYEVYKWELKAGNKTINPGGISRSPSVAPGISTAHPVCSSTSEEPVGDTDRRMLTIAVVNCGASTLSLNGKTHDVHVQKWVDVFLVEPSAPRTRTTANDVYVEVIKERNPGSNASGGNIIRRDVPYLVQ